MLVKGTARLEPSVLGLQFSRAPLRPFVPPPECSELWAGHLPRVAPWPLLPAESFDPSCDWDSVCEHCGGLFLRSVGASGRFCSRLCYETPTPARYAKQKRYRDLRKAQGLCPRCGEPSRDGYNCAECRAKIRPAQTARTRKARGHQAWRPGSHGPAPMEARPLLAAAELSRKAILASEQVRGDEPLARAAIVLLCGFFFRQRLDWIVRWTGFRRSECQQIIGRLYRYGIWHDGGTMACSWLDIFFGQRKVPKRQRWETEVAFWLDAGVGCGEFTREGDPPDCRYGLPAWESDTSRSPR